MKCVEKINQAIALLSLAAVIIGGVFVYQLHAKQKNLEEFIPSLAAS